MCLRRTAVRLSLPAPPATILRESTSDPRWVGYFDAGVAGGATMWSVVLSIQVACLLNVYVFVFGVMKAVHDDRYRAVNATATVRTMISLVVCNGLASVGDT